MVMVVFRVDSGRRKGFLRADGRRGRGDTCASARTTRRSVTRRIHFVCVRTGNGVSRLSFAECETHATPGEPSEEVTTNEISNKNSPCALAPTSSDQFPHLEAAYVNVSNRFIFPFISVVIV